MSRFKAHTTILAACASLIVGVGAPCTAANNDSGVATSDRIASTSKPGIDDDAATVSAPSNGTLLGMNVAKRQTRNGFTEVAAVEQQLGRQLDVVNRFHEFSAGLTSAFHFDRLHIERGRTLMISWRATDNPGSTRGTTDPNRASKISQGRYDREIRAMARKLKGLDAPVLVRFNWEMDQAPGQNQYIGTPEEFRRAWRYVHGLFEAEGADNVSWVWAPRAASFNKNAGQRFYPGDAYVDWIGGSAVPINSYRTPQEIYGAWYEWSSNKDKPLLMWVGLRENPNDSSWKPEFLSRIHALAAGDWDELSALVYYHANSPKGIDYWANTTARSWSAFKKMSCSATFTRPSGNTC